MGIEIALPFGDRKGVKSLIFTILTKEYPLRIIDLTNLIKKRYGRSVTFQGVRKALTELQNDEVILKQDGAFLINKEWVLESKKVLDELHLELTGKHAKPKSLDSIGGDMSVFSFHSLNELMVFWENIIDNWFKTFKKGDPNVNSYQGAHLWEALIHPSREQEIMGQLKKKGIKSFAVSTSNTPLDRNTAAFFRRTGVKMMINPSSGSFDKGYYVGTYGALVVQTQYPEDLIKELDQFYKKNISIDKLDLTALAKIVNKKREMKLTVIKNLAMAKQINKSIIDQIAV